MKSLIFSLLTGYLLGSVPTAYVFGRWVRGIDLREYGSGTVSGTSVYYHVAPWAAVLVWVLDCAKGALPAWLSLRTGPGIGRAVAAGTGAVIGHNWSLFLGFKGGRGISAYAGWMLVVFPKGFMTILASLILGRVARTSAELTLLAITALAMPFWHSRPAVQVGCLVMLAATVGKRLEANHLPLPAGPDERRRVVIRRLFRDRDTEESDSWVHRQPEAEPERHPGRTRSKTKP